MDELKRKIKVLIPEEKHLEIDKIFCDWIASLKVHTILEKEVEGEMSKEGQRETKECTNIYRAETEERNFQREKIPLKCQIEDLKRQIESFKQKMRTYRQSSTTSTDSALSEVKEEIGRVREGILKMRLNFGDPEECEKDAENAELIKKLDEVKQFLEKLK